MSVAKVRGCIVSHVSDYSEGYIGIEERSCRERKTCAASTVMLMCLKYSIQVTRQLLQEKVEMDIWNWGQRERKRLSL